MTDASNPKLLINKPKKGQLKTEPKGFSSPSISTAPSSAGAAPPPPPPPPTQSFARRYKFLWPLLLTVNLAIGGYLFLRTNTKKNDEEGDEVTEETSAAPASPTAAVAEKPSSTLLIPQPVEVRPPIPEDEQRQLLKWILEEKRKVKPENSLEKKRIDDEKALLKEFIRSKSIPSF